MDTVLTDRQREIVLANLPLVEHIVNRVGASLPAVHSRDDLVQAGIVGLITATIRFDPEAGAAFSTFAGRRIEGAIIDLLRKADWAPRSVRSLERRLGAVAERAGATPPSVAELSAELGISATDLARLQDDIHRSRLDSLDRPVGDDGLPSPLAELVDDRRALVEEVIDDQELIGYLRSGVALLPVRHRMVVVGYFFEGRSITDLGHLLGVTQSRASQIKEEALQMLRKGLAEVYQTSSDPEQATARQREFSETLAGYHDWRHRLDAGKGFTAAG
ncbi:MAG: sigma-70 family RNA polymerase sigma factor [Acidimicrobiales bacterium]